MKTEHYTCDRCDNDIHEWTKPVNDTICIRTNTKEGVRGIGHEGYLDLCDGCISELVLWLTKHKTIKEIILK